MQRKRIASWLVALSDPAGLRPSLPERRLRSRDLAPLCRHAEVHGVLPAVAANLREAVAALGPERIVRVPAGSCPAADDLGAALAAVEGRLRRYKVFATLLRCQAEEIGAALSEHSLSAAVLKGPEFAERLYPRTTLRLYKDLDLLVRSQAVPEVEEVLERLGHVPVRVPRGRGWVNLGCTWRRPDGRGGVVDVHWDLSHPLLVHRMSLRFEDLEFQEPQAASGLLRPTASSLLFVAAAHAATPHTFSRMQCLWDVCQAARGVAGPVDARWLAQAAARTRGGIAVVAALRLGRDVLGDDACGALLARLPQAALLRGAGATVPPRLWVGLVTGHSVVWPNSASGKARRLLFRWLWRRG